MLSLTIVLNDAFAGGGTYFADLRRALSPGVGHVIAFDGRALHGGEPIVRGTRYIVAAFLYVEDAHEGSARQRTARGSEGLAGVFGATKERRQKRAREEDGAPAVGTSAGDEDTSTGGFTFNFQ